jgi:hypothetical protein
MRASAPIWRSEQKLGCMEKMTSLKPRHFGRFVGRFVGRFKRVKR